MTEMLLTNWPWTLGYLAVGVLIMCIIQYIKGRRNLSICDEMSYDLGASAAVFFWPLAIVMAVAVAALIVLVWPWMKLSGFCTNLGRKHRKGK